MFEMLLSAFKARAQPQQVFWLAIVFVTLGVFVAVAIPSVRGSAVIFTMIPAIPLFVSLLLGEERKTEEALHKSKTNFLGYHEKLLELFAYFFVGAVVAYAIWYAILPPAISQTVFVDQISEIKKLASSLSGFAFFKPVFDVLFLHNFWVLLLVFVFSLLYGIGSLYILLWNASLVGAFIGQKLLAGGLPGLVTGVLGILPHGIFEIGAYFVAAIAGGLLSAAVMRDHYYRPEFRFVLRDVAILGILSTVLLAVGALVESSL